MYFNYFYLPNAPIGTKSLVRFTTHYCNQKIFLRNTNYFMLSLTTKNGCGFVFYGQITRIKYFLNILTQNNNE